MRIDPKPVAIPPVQIVETPPKPEQSFGEMFSNYINDVNDLQMAAGEMAQRYAQGEPIDEHALLIAMERAGIAFQLTLHARNKVLEAYQEVMRMQV
ncbi:MAG: flagellar hook-basal body complex protein FliE [Armatimonadetes bacterium]|nr:flagellar hook-basal body complex protein FliE [Armatimonadota bacterium]